MPVFCLLSGPADKNKGSRPSLIALQTELQPRSQGLRGETGDEDPGKIRFVVGKKIACAVRHNRIAMTVG